MAQHEIRLLSRLVRSVQSLVDQPDDDPAQYAFSRADFADAANYAQDELFRDASMLDADWTLKETTVSIPAGTTAYALPDDCRGLRKTSEWDSTNDEELRPLAVGEWGQLGRRDYDCLFKGKDADNSNAPTLRFLKPTPRALTVKIVYEYHPPTLAHGILQEDAGASSFVLEEHEPDENDVLVGGTLHIVKDPNGSAYGSQAISTWSGETRAAGFATPWSPIPKKGAYYTMRPDLPKDLERVYVLEMGVVLGIKLPDRLYEEWRRERERKLLTAKHRLKTMERRAAKITRFRSVVGPGFTGDPINNNRWQ